MGTNAIASMLFEWTGYSKHPLPPLNCHMNFTTEANEEKQKFFTLHRESLQQDCHGSSGPLSSYKENLCKSSVNTYPQHFCLMCAIYTIAHYNSPSVNSLSWPQVEDE